MAKPPSKPPAKGAPKPPAKGPARTPTDEERAALTAERREAQAREGEQAMAEYLAHIKAEREKTARLRALRLAKEAQERKNAEKVKKETMFTARNNRSRNMRNGSIAVLLSPHDVPATLRAPATRLCTGRVTPRAIRNATAIAARAMKTRSM